MPRPVAASIPIEYEPVMIALQKARAARILLEADCGHLQIPIRLSPEENEGDIRDWIESFAFEALDGALKEAEAAYRKVRAGEEDA